jgi:Phage Terminase
MIDALTTAALARWRAHPIAFILETMNDPETGRPFVLSPAERAFLERAFTLDDDGRLRYPELLFGAIKKSGKTTLAAIIMLVMVLLLGGRFAEGYCVANDLEQAVSRVFTMVRRIVEASPLLHSGAKIIAERISFPALGATITAIGADYAGAAGANPTITCFDELWGYTSERARRLWDEMVTSPARKISCRLTVSYAGFSGESALLEELYRRGKALPEVAPSLHAGDGMLFAWRRTLQLYPNADIRLAMSRAIAIETARGLRADRERHCSIACDRTCANARRDRRRDRARNRVIRTRTEWRPACATGPNGRAAPRSRHSARGASPSAGRLPGSLLGRRRRSNVLRR